jgi:hypothetical protein
VRQSDTLEMISGLTGQRYEIPLREFGFAESLKCMRYLFPMFIHGEKESNSGLFALQSAAM